MVECAFGMRIWTLVDTFDGFAVPRYYSNLQASKGGALITPGLLSMVECAFGMQASYLGLRTRG